MKAARELEKGAPDSKASDGMKGYWTLVRSRLADEEVKHVIGLSGGQLKLSLIRQHLTELYPRSSYKSGGPRAYLADDDGGWLEGAYGEGWDELDGAWPAKPADEDGFYDADDGEDAAYWAGARDATWYGDSWDAARSCTRPSSPRTRRWRPRPRPPLRPTTALRPAR